MSAGHNALRSAAFDAAARSVQHRAMLGMTAFERHKKMIADYERYYGGSAARGEQAEGSAGPLPRTDEQVLRDTYRFIRDESDDRDAGGGWEATLAKRYYARLFKEYAIADLSRYKEGKVGLRWRTKAEVVSGKGQFVCGCRGCAESQGLASFEVPFVYAEAGVRKQALLKVRLCSTHAYQLNYRKLRQLERDARRDAKRKAKREAKEARRKRRRSGGGSGRDGGGGGSGGRSDSESGRGSGSDEEAAGGGGGWSSGGAAGCEGSERGAAEARAGAGAPAAGSGDGGEGGSAAGGGGDGTGGDAADQFLRGVFDGLFA